MWEAMAKAKVGITVERKPCAALFGLSEIVLPTLQQCIDLHRAGFKQNPRRGAYPQEQEDRGTKSNPQM